MVNYHTLWILIILVVMLSVSLENMMNNQAHLVSKHVLETHADVISEVDKGLLDDICEMFSINHS